MFFTRELKYTQKMKDFRNYLFAISALVIAFLLFRGCQQEKKITELESSSKGEQYLRDIVLLRSKIKSYSATIGANRLFQDSIITLNKQLVEREKNRVKISAIKPVKTIKVTEDYKPDVQDTGEYISDNDYDSLQAIGTEVQNDLSKALEKNIKLDSTIHVERVLQASKDTSNNTIIARQQEAITEKEKEKEKLQKKLRVSKFFLKAGAVAIAVLSVIVAAK